MPASGWPVAHADDAAARCPPIAAPAASLPPAAPAQDDVLPPLREVAARQGLRPLADRLEELRVWLADDLKALETSVTAAERAAILDGNGAMTQVGQAARHLLVLAGKRIRPLCVILAARLHGRSMDAAVRDVATACELVHAATLLHDDVVDDSHERRGAAAARTLYGNSASILAGDHLLVHALRLVTGAGPAASLLPSLLDVMTQMVRAEALQLERRGRFEPSREAYLEVIRGKTAALFAWGLAAGGVLGNASAEVQAALRQVGLHLGRAFQLVDDVLDMEGDPRLTGKDALQDVREGKLTWPLILAAEAEPALAKQLATVARGAAAPHASADAAGHAYGAASHAAWMDEQLHHVRARVTATGALAATRAFALREAEAACACLAQLPAGKSRDALALVIQSAVHRLR